MAATISDGTTSIYPTLVLSYASSRASGNKKHDLLGGGASMSLGKAGLRTGTLELFFPVEADAAAAEDLHRTAGVFTFTDPDRTSVAMSYVLADGGELVRELDDETRDAWIVRVAFQEVAV